MVSLNRGKRLTSLINRNKLTSLSRQRSLLLSATILSLFLLFSLLQNRTDAVYLKLGYAKDSMLMEANSKMEEIQVDASRQPLAATKQQQEVGQSQIQLSHVSAMNRYPDEYEAVREYLGGRDSKNKASKYKLLSFGSATGEEAITLATMYYPDNGGGGDNTVIFGVDLHQESIDKARASWVAATTTNKGGEIIPLDKVTFLNGKDTSISAHGPYDAIFANSVLCYHDIGLSNPESILEKYPFEQFESSLGYLDASLKVGGVLAIVNTNYHFSRSEISKRYTPLLAKCANFVPKVDAETVAYERSDTKNDIKWLMEDCVWVKK